MSSSGSSVCGSTNERSGVMPKGCQHDMCGASRERGNGLTTLSAASMHSYRHHANSATTTTTTSSSLSGAASGGWCGRISGALRSGPGTAIAGS